MRRNLAINKNKKLGTQELLRNWEEDEENHEEQSQIGQKMNLKNISKN